MSVKTSIVGALLLGLCGALVGVGCGARAELDPSPGRGAADDDVAPVASGAFINEYYKTMCNQVFHCCDAAEIGDLFTEDEVKPKNEAECVANLVARYVASNDTTWQSVDEGRQEYNGKKAALCFSKMKNTCVDLLLYREVMVTDPDCAAIFTSKVAEGGACTLNADCKVAKSRCFNNVCRGPGEVGAPCSVHTDCKSDSCTLFKCAAKKANGDSCWNGHQCENGRCDSSTHTCANEFAEGAACSISDDCETGNCEVFVCAAKRADGAACSTSSECQNERCDFDTKVCMPKQKRPACDGQ